jgi:hypothetical protein
MFKGEQYEPVPEHQQKNFDDCGDRGRGIGGRRGSFVRHFNSFQLEK